MTKGKSYWTEKGLQMWLVRARTLITTGFCFGLCVLAADNIASKLLPEKSWRQFSVAVILVLMFSWLLENAFWAYARQRMEMFVASDFPHGSNNRQTYLKVYGSDFFLPPGQEMVLRTSDDGRSVEVLAGNTEVPPLPPTP